MDSINTAVGRLPKRGWDCSVAGPDGPASRDLRLFLLVARHFMSDADMRVAMRHDTLDQLGVCMGGTRDEAQVLLGQAVQEGWLTAGAEADVLVYYASIPGWGVVR